MSTRASGAAPMHTPVNIDVVMQNWCEVLQQV